MNFSVEVSPGITSSSAVAACLMAKPWGMSQSCSRLVMPGETSTLKFVPTQPGVYPFYCTDFCSALHQEMQGYMRVSPKGSNVPLKWHTGGTDSTAAVAAK